MEEKNDCIGKCGRCFLVYHYNNRLLTASNYIGLSSTPCPCIDCLIKKMCEHSCEISESWVKQLKSILKMDLNYKKALKI